MVVQCRNDHSGIEYSAIMENSHSPRHDASAPRAVLFDAYGTLFDVYSVAQLAELTPLFHGLVPASLMPGGAGPRRR